MQRITLTFADGEAIELSDTQSRQLLTALWDVGLASPGAVASAAKIAETLRSDLRKRVELDPRESTAVQTIIRELHLEPLR